ncbi:MAG TPA: Rieske 2Fe-2S domain-containing protein [Candidatus Binatia bacterium]
MLSREENAYLTQVGAGTPAGELLRRYWHPVAVAGELTDEKPIKAVRILGENLVVFRDRQGHYGLVAERCPHRSASLAYGRVDEEGIRCPYHGWKFDRGGRCLEQPAEPPESTFKDRIRQRAYPVEKLAGLLFAYLGPAPVPLVPRWDVLVREDGKRWTVIDSLIDCNWLQPTENSVDPAHLFWLHGDSAHLPSHSPHYGESHDFIRFDYGIMKRRTTPGKKAGDPPAVDQHPLIFPATLRHVARGRKDGGFRHNLQIRVPVDDTHTQVYRVNFMPTATDRAPADQDPPFEHSALKGPDGRFNMTMVSAQDAMAWETQGGVTDRSQENLGSSDTGVITFRKLLKEQIDIVLSGGEPMGVMRDPEKNKIIEFDVINERIGLYRSTDKKVA